MGRLLIAILDNYQQPRQRSPGPRSPATGRAEKRPATERRVMGERLDGRAIAAQVQEELLADIARLKQEHGIVPGLASRAGGRRPGPRSPTCAPKAAPCEALGIHSEQIDLPANATTEDVLATVEQLNARRRDPRHLDTATAAGPKTSSKSSTPLTRIRMSMACTRSIWGRLVRQEECVLALYAARGFADSQPQRDRGGWPARGRSRPQHARGTARSHLAGAQGGRGQCHGDPMPHRHPRPRALHAPSGRP